MGVSLLGLLGLVYSAYFATWIDRGDWTCQICAIAEHRTQAFATTIWSGASTARHDEPLEQYRAWWTSSVGLEHEHLWTPTGDHSAGFGPCKLRPHAPRLLLLCARMPPGDDVRRIATVLARSTGDVRARLWIDVSDKVWSNKELRSEPDAEHRLARLARESDAWRHALSELDASEQR